MKLHRNARLTPSGRRLLVHRVHKLGWSVTRSSRESGVSRRTGRKWLARFEAEGEAGLEDRSSRPRRQPARTAAAVVRQIERLRRHRKTGWEIAEQLRMPASTVSKLLREHGLGRLWRVDEANAPPHRYEHDSPGGMFHVDAKKLARGLGHRIHGDRRRRHRGAGWETVFVCVDDHTRLAYAEVLTAENAADATAFFGRALRRFEDQGIRCQRLLTDNARCYSSHAFETLYAQHGIRHVFTKPYTPRTNGKAERFIQTPALGLPLAVPDLRDPLRGAAALAPRVQSPPAPQSPRHETPDRSPQSSSRTTCLGPTPSPGLVPGIPMIVTPASLQQTTRRFHRAARRRQGWRRDAGSAYDGENGRCVWALPGAFLTFEGYA